MVSEVWRIEGFKGNLAIISYGLNEYGDGPAGYVGEFPIPDASKMVEEHNAGLKRKPGRPRIHPDRKAYQAEWVRKKRERLASNKARG